MKKKTICIAGKNEIAINALRFVINGYPELSIVACPNRTDNAKDSWQPSFKKYCLDNQVDTLELQDLYDKKNLLFFSLEFDRIIPVQEFKSQSLFNIHFSYLPAYKGMYTSTWPILNGETQTGVTLHKIDRGIDTGDIIAQKKIIIEEEDTARDLYFKYLNSGTELFKEYFEKILKEDYETFAQSRMHASYYAKSSIDYSNICINLVKTAHEIKRQIRAYSFKEYQLAKICGHKIIKSEILKTRSIKKPGTIIRETDKFIDLATIDYDIRLHKLSLITHGR